MTPDFSASLTKIRAEFEDLVKDLRPELHRYCARMVGSAIDGEDVVQEALAKAFYSLPNTDVTNLRGWVFRIAHNKAVDLVRGPGEEHLDEWADAAADPPLEKAETLSMALSLYLQLPVKQRCCVVLKDVLDHSLAEIAELLDVSLSDVKASLHRGRAKLRELAKQPAPAPSVLTAAQTALLQKYIEHFNARDFTALRTLLTDDVRIDLVSRWQRRGAEAKSYFSRYGELLHWSFAAGTVDDHPAILIYDQKESEKVLHSFILLEWQNDLVSAIRDYVMLPYVLTSARVVESAG